MHEHRPVLLDEAVQALALRPDGTYVDGTYGRGGHSGAILARLGGQGRLIAFDKDPEAVAHARQTFGADPRFSIERGSFTMLERVIDREGLRGMVHGILLDLGVSSPQLESSDRGFSFARSGPLDMRMDPASGESAAQWLARASEREIETVLREYGEERYARRVARAVVAARAREPITDTARLATIVAEAVPTRERGQHPATRTFQALRIRVNNELDELAECLAQCVRVLAAGGRLAVISFHSLEDRIVKHFMRGESQPAAGPRNLPPPPARAPTLRLVGRAIRPGAEEVARNPRARSAILRVAERLP
ncbi:MAG TPA: 16S rRNA (cytosine(1402)-N(4))-methyltransferase RsmH [Gammaproteobacteria bacterium]|nr:16S rRNA (cytosine(1402)-N(4))-methyltransferase RsmH [Gammaproteobacteria bacterium]